MGLYTPTRSFLTSERGRDLNADVEADGGGGGAWGWMDPEPFAGF